MEPFESEQRRPPGDHHPLLGIFIGLVIAFVVWLLMRSVFFFVNPSGRSIISYLLYLIGSLVICPPVAVTLVAVFAWRKRQFRYATGLFIAAALVTLLGGSCAVLFLQVVSPIRWKVNSAFSLRSHENLSF